ncbi:hypothetical protein F4818DRAFT_424658 [Hypoxylon cercidicola]|nr:hypothetical protein F4818DRAFT_424658 [Hypoxylon cercidicola]
MQRSNPRPVEANKALPTSREYPCNHCARRQCPEDCVYYPTTGSLASSPAALPEPRRGDASRTRTRSVGNRLRNEWSAFAETAMPVGPWSSSSLAESYGYFEDSESNTLALVRKLGLARRDTPYGGSVALLPEAVDEVQRNVERMPDRQILDFVVQYFAAEVNWIDQFVHAPWFLARYQAWWKVEQVRLASEVDFAVLILRICSYALHFLPSPGYTLDKIRGVLLADVRSMCDDTADNLEAISVAADGRGSLIRVQYLAFSGLQCQIEGTTTAFWEVVGRATRVAQSIGMDSDLARSRHEMDEADREMERRTFCSLFVCDSLLSRQLDRIAFIPGLLCPENWPKLRPLDGRAVGDGIESCVEVPDPFTERALQARLADFWRGAGPVQGVGYDLIAAEERYGKFCREYLVQLPPAFALVDPDETWDDQCPKLPMQRKLLHIAIYDSVCWNFRPLLLWQPPPLPAYKRVLLASQKKALAVAALRSMDSVMKLHDLLGGCHTRLVGIVISTFEAAVLLVHLYTDPMLPGDHARQPTPQPGMLNADPLQVSTHAATRLGCLQAIQGALKRLQMLAEVSSLADIGARTIVQLLSKVSEVNAGTTGPGPGPGPGPDEVALFSNQETENTAPYPPRVTTATGEVESWLPCDPAGLSSVGDFMAIGDMVSWPSFDPSTMYSHDL